MALQKLSLFLKTFEQGSAPDVRTVKKWIKNGDIYGLKIGNLYYVDIDKEPEQKLHQAANDDSYQEVQALVSKVLKSGN